MARRKNEFKKCGRKWSWPILRYYPAIRLEELNKIMKELRSETMTSIIRSRNTATELKI